MRFLRILHWRARARYWHRRAEKLGHTVDLLRRELNAECQRNRTREDAFASASMFGRLGMYGIPAREGSALPPKPQPMATPTDPWAMVPEYEKMEFDCEWWPLAQQNNRSLIQARQDFMVELANRKQLNDEPFLTQ